MAGGIILTIIVVLAVLVPIQIIKNKETDRIRQEYMDAMRRGDKSAALMHGRAYYSRMRGGSLTIYDEQAIANDLASMK